VTLLPDEARLFFLAIKPRDSRDDGALAALAAAPLRWRLVTHIAEHERMVSVLWKGLNGRVSGMPADLEAAVRRRTAVTEFRMTATRVTLERVVARLTAEGIPVLLLKGAALGHSVYPSFADRPMNDLDVLVPPELATQAWTCMRDLGWALEQDDGIEFYDEFHHLKPLVDPSRGGIVLEIHRSMMPRPGPFSLSESDVWRDASEVRVGRFPARIPSELHQLLHLSVHFAWQHSLVHGIARTVRDVATLTTARSIDWDAFVRLARRANAATCAYWTLALARRLGGARVPDDALAPLRPRQPRALTAALERAYVVSGILDLCPSMQLAQALWTAGVQPERSGHGAQRPWQMTTRFEAAFHQELTVPVMARVRNHLRDLAPWLRFARVVAGGSGGLAAR